MKESPVKIDSVLEPLLVETSDNQIDLLISGVFALAMLYAQAVLLKEAL